LNKSNNSFDGPIRLSAAAAAAADNDVDDDVAAYSRDDDEVAIVVGVHTVKAVTIIINEHEGSPHRTACTPNATANAPRKKDDDDEEEEEDDDLIII
jgi:hypothetical protein